MLNLMHHYFRLLINKLAFWPVSSFVLRKLGQLLPKDDKLALFGAMNGNWYGDNSRYLYEWTLKQRPDIHPVWVTNNEELCEEMRKASLPVILSNSLYAIFLLCRANVAVFTNSMSDLTPYPFLIPDTLRLIALRHGRSVKRVRFARMRHKIDPQEAKLRRRESDLIKYAISTSDFISDLQEECLRIGRSKHIVTGYPRNDLLTVDDPPFGGQWERFLDGRNPGKVVLYAPSWRHGREPTRFFPFPDFNPNHLFEFLSEHNILLLLRPHVNDLLQYESLQTFLYELASDSDMIQLATHHVFPDINQIIPFVNILVTDYSALYHDFLLLDRPIMFIPYDYNEFKAQNGFLYDYFSKLPGPEIESFADFCDFLLQVSLGADNYQEKRRFLRDEVHTFKDNNSCERVMQLLDKLRLKNESL